MLRSMYSGISGMKNFQTKLDVIGNNISNVNTYGFKKGRTIFKDLVSQQIAGASAPGANIGGTNPKQIGLGSQLAAVDTIHTTGSLQTTARPLDLAISGDGLFVVGTGTGTPATVEGYTRAGNFYLDQQGYMVNADGYYVLGATGTGTPSGTITDTANSTNVSRIQIPTNAKSFSIGADGKVTFINNTGTLQTAGTIAIAKFANNDGLSKSGNNLFKNTTNSGNPVMNAPSTGGTGTIVAGTLEMSNVDLSEEFTEMIVAQRGFQANTRIITTSDEILQELVNLKR
ncbi:flagellar basal body rod protein FlgG [Metabacillus iocasae]|uniref:Flagellar hook protein FlgE n=1 Tax=Priestia iocasae TaxID=2291674 RepID=A0ABS2QQZ1_9BACI|nr:flagellar basal body rod protein FlgG [Metabacillus iocasae]MBM7701871.1 flagellar hook protein FlgE [Metabacillus iocasae]